MDDGAARHSKKSIVLKPGLDGKDKKFTERLQERTAPVRRRLDGNPVARLLQVLCDFVAYRFMNPG
jgi:hypothetical protein